MGILQRIKGLVLPFIFSGFFYSCTPDVDLANNVYSPAPDFATKVTVSTISGFVTDEANMPIQGATVEAGGINTTTDIYGYFEIRNAEVVQTAATVTIQKVNFFKTIRTFYARAGKGAFFRVKLMSRTLMGTINGATGGGIYLPSGFGITLPANGVMIASSNTPYTGTVAVFAKHISAASPDLNSLMPGDLRGLNNSNAMQLLTTYGMVVVELTASNGALLQMATGKKATIIVPIPVSMQAGAQANIPLWYFDESNGLWKEEGSANNTGNAYVGEVSHFSFWNCDWPAPLVRFDVTIMGSNGVPLSNVMVSVALASNPNIHGTGYTDFNGFLSGYIPANSQLILSIHPPTACNTPYVQNFTTTGSNISLGTITFNVPNGLATLSGNITDCNNNPLANGQVVLISNGQAFRVTANNNGAYTLNTLLCANSPNIVTLVAVNPATNQQGTPLNYTLNPGNNAIPVLQACGISNAIFINQVINGVPYNQVNPPNVVNTLNPGNNNIGIGYFLDVTMTIPGQIIFSGNGIGLGTDQPLISYNGVPSGPPVLVHITEYGPVGQFISGNFAGTFTSGNITRIVTCSFRIRRTF